MMMRYKLFSVICAILLVAGCTKLPQGKSYDDVIAAVSAPFSFTGTASMEGISQPVKLKVKKAANGLTVEILEPEAVKGLMLEFGEGNVKTTFRGLVMNMSPLDIPQQSLFIALRDVLSAVPSEDAEFTKSDGMVTVSDKAGMLPYELIWSADDLVLRAVRMPSLGGIIQIDSFIKST